VVLEGVTVKLFTFVGCVGGKDVLALAVINDNKTELLLLLVELELRSFSVFDCCGTKADGRSKLVVAAFSLLTGSAFTKLVVALNEEGVNELLSVMVPLCFGKGKVVWHPSSTATKDTC